MFLKFKEVFIIQKAVQSEIRRRLEKTRTKEFALKLNKSKQLYLLFFLPAVYYVVFHYMPMFGNVIAFQDYNVFGGFLHSKWVGLKHFQEFLSDPYFWKLVRNTVLINVYLIIFYFPAPIIFALLLNELKLAFFKRVVQSIAYLPHFLSTAVVVGMVVNFLAIDGMMNRLIEFFGIHQIQFLTKAQWFRTVFVSMEIWHRTGWGTIIYLAALTGIDTTLYEAATIDGAGRLKRMWHVTLPGIAPVITVLFLLNLGEILTVGFEKVLLLYTGSTYETADVIQTYVYRRGLLESDFSYAAAVGIFQSVLAFALVMSANKISKKVSETSLF